MQDVHASLARSQPLPKLPGMFFRSLFTVARNDQDEAPATELKANFTAAALNAEHVKAYREAFDGFVSEVPLTLMYCLAQRVHLAQMLGEDFPWPAPGLVHVSNRLEQHAAIALDASFTIHAHIKLPARGPKVSPRRLRPLFTVEFWQADTKVVTCVSEYQVMPKTTGKTNKPREKKKGQLPGEDWQPIGEWSLDTTAGRSYARLSGDFNPIHIHPLLSRWFGFEQPIIHGMYMAGRAQAEIERQHQRPVQAIDVTFKRPVPLPASISLWQQPSSTTDGRYQIFGADDQLQRLEGNYTLTAE
ncbi:acyl dehydratase [Pseudidiomarina sediminum]|uniref:Acyl dehydratase n=1 Tax=Pseudidiomarina sediminum TaxID=431675 RepID=A0A432Z2G9_9GAMM|nr:MaoC/PaaZ C-terminal domain-containing protein [Pseudidiomarina sediminum]MBY6064408.1 acyl dehydratase [Pseudidiomarina sediminum]RUO72080.1 acyl dehydratase [Pseudidiomarina sediminum]